LRLTAVSFYVIALHEHGLPSNKFLKNITIMKFLELGGFKKWVTILASVSGLKSNVRDKFVRGSRPQESAGGVFLLICPNAAYKLFWIWRRCAITTIAINEN
jgi:hypothetical protein